MRKWPILSPLQCKGSPDQCGGHELPSRPQWPLICCEIYVLSMVDSRCVKFQITMEILPLYSIARIISSSGAMADVTLEGPSMNQYHLYCKIWWNHMLHVLQDATTGIPHKTSSATYLPATVSACEWWDRRRISMHTWREKNIRRITSEIIQSAPLQICFARNCFSLITYIYQWHSSVEKVGKIHVQRLRPRAVILANGSCPCISFLADSWCNEICTHRRLHMCIWAPCI